MPRLDTRLESEGAEFLVLGQLLLVRIATYKTYTNMPGYDLVATNPDKNTSAKIQVKSRWGTGSSGFPIKNFGCDFVVFCRLNRGNKAGTRKVSAPEYFVLPVAVVRTAQRTNSSWGKVYLRDIPNADQYRDRWDLVREALGMEQPTSAAPNRVPTVVGNAKPSSRKADGVIATIRSMIEREDGATRGEILESLVAKFPQRDQAGMSNTVAIQVSRLAKTIGPIVKARIADRGLVYSSRTPTLGR
jgi:hypothetical protein